MRKIPKGQVQKYYIGESGTPVLYATTPDAKSINGFQLFDMFMQIQWLEIKIFNERGKPHATAQVKFTPTQFSLEHRCKQGPPVPVQVDGQSVGYIEHNRVTSFILYRDFPFDYAHTLTEAELIGDALVIRAPDELRNVVRKTRRGIA